MTNEEKVEDFKKKELVAAETGTLPTIGSAELPSELAAFKMEEGDSWGAGQDVEEKKELFVNDFLIPKLWLIQAMSELRIEGKASEGDFANSISGEVLSNGSSEEAVTFCIVNSFKRWQTFKINEKGKKEFVESETVTLKNANYQYEFKKDGIPHTRRQVLSYTVLLGSDLNKGLNRPYVLDFAGASKRAGRIIVTEINEMHDAGYPSAVLLFSMTSKQEKNDEGTFFTRQVKKIGFTSPAVLEAAKKTYKLLKIHEDQIEVDERDVIKADSKELDNV